MVCNVQDLSFTVQVGSDNRVDLILAELHVIKNIFAAAVRSGWGGIA